MKSRILSALFLLQIFAVSAAEPVKIIFDTDMVNDCDNSDGHTEWKSDRDRNHEYVRTKGDPKKLGKVPGDWLSARPAGKN